MNQIQKIKIDELVKSLNLFELVSHLLCNVETFSHFTLTAMGVRAWAATFNACVPALDDINNRVDNWIKLSYYFQ